MYFSPSFVVLALPFLVAANPLANPPEGHGVPVPIAKRGNTEGNNLHKYASLAQASVA